MRTTFHQQHIDSRRILNNCPECRADNSRRFAVTTPFRYVHVHEYLSWARPRIEAIANGQDSLEARWWLRDFRRAMNARINTHLPARSGRKHAPDYAKYHLATYGNDYHFLNT